MRHDPTTHIARLRLALRALVLLGAVSLLAASGGDLSAAPSPAPESAAGDPGVGYEPLAPWRADAPETLSADPPPAGRAAPVDPEGIARLVADSGGEAQVSLSRATGAAMFVRLPDGAELTGVADESTDLEARTTALLAEYGGVFGLSDPGAELDLGETRSDHLGATRLTYNQTYRGVPVFAGLLRAHYAADGRLAAINGNIVPGIAVDPRPTLSPATARATAVAHVGPSASVLAPVAVGAELYVFRANMARGAPGANHLAFEVEVTNGLDVRELVYVDAHTGKVIDQITGLHDERERVIYAGQYDPTDLDAHVARREGDPPTGEDEVDGLYDFAGDSYNLFYNTFEYDSWDGEGAVMRSLQGWPSNACPNAQWTGSYTRFCEGVASDDVAAHEWGHAYTGSTHGLIYQWQPGALNESYSDIFGELIDLLNEAGTDEPGARRSDGSCTLYRPPSVNLTANAPEAVAGEYNASLANFGPRLDEAGVTGDVVLVMDGSDNPTRGCEPLVNGDEVNGNIALVDRFACNFVVKVKNAQDVGAVAVIVANNVAGAPFGMGGSDASITIPSIMISRDDGATFKTALGDGLNVTMVLKPAEGDDSYRWLMGEDSSGFGYAIRDMWNPNCNGHPGKVTDDEYHCATSDSGGVHRNSGIPNHGFALAVDGGTYNGFTIEALGPTKAAHIYWRAMSTYQHPMSHFADHAAALEQSCQDLIGIDLRELMVGTLPGPAIEPADCDELAKVIAAIELRTEPIQCEFEPMLDPEPPALCGGADAETVYFEDFEAGADDWTASMRDVADPGQFENPGWLLVERGPDEEERLSFRPGSQFFADNPLGGNCANNDQSGVVILDSPAIELPVPDGVLGRPLLTFDHSLATETGFDGGNLKVRVGDGPWRTVAPDDILYNSYSRLMSPAGPNENSPANTSPLAGEFGFTGTDGGWLESGWGTTQVDLSRFAAPGDTVQLRFELASDCGSGRIGWYVDDVQVAYCSTCGDMVLDAGETCDDGNADGGDGCSDSCQVEWFWACTEPVPGGDVVADGGFEAALPNPVWTVMASDGGSPLCAAGDCGGNLAVEGDRWASLGFDATEPVTTTLTQVITFTAQTPELHFAAMAPSCGNQSGGNALRAAVDSTDVFTTTATGNAPNEVCGVNYTDVSVDVSAYADGVGHTLTFESMVGNWQGFVVDRVTAPYAPEASVCTYEGPPGIYLPVLHRHGGP